MTCMHGTAKRVDFFTIQRNPLRNIIIGRAEKGKNIGSLLSFVTGKQKIQASRESLLSL